MISSQGSPLILTTTGEAGVRSVFTDESTETPHDPLSRPTPYH